MAAGGRAGGVGRTDQSTDRRPADRNAPLRRAAGPERAPESPISRLTGLSLAGSRTGRGCGEAESPPRCRLGGEHQPTQTTARAARSRPRSAEHRHAWPAPQHPKTEDPARASPHFALMLHGAADSYARPHTSPRQSPLPQHHPSTSPVPAPPLTMAPSSARSRGTVCGKRCTRSRRLARRVAGSAHGATNRRVRDGWPGAA